MMYGGPLGKYSEIQIISQFNIWKKCVLNTEFTKDQNRVQAMFFGYWSIEMSWKWEVFLFFWMYLFIYISS